MGWGGGFVGLRFAACRGSAYTAAMEQHDNDARPIPNPYAGSATYRCFGCSPDNAIGLQLTFALQGERVIAEWTPRTDLEGYPGVVHGGIQATLADETAAWLIHAVLGTSGVTRELSVRYHQPAQTEDAPFVIKADKTAQDGRNVTIEVQIEGAGGTLFTTARCVYVVFSEEVARKRLGFPGAAAFKPTE